MSTTTEIALRRFVRSCAREARLAAFLGQRKYADALRSGVSDAIIEHRAAIPTTAAPLAPETQRRRAVAQAWATTLATWTGGPPRPR